MRFQRRSARTGFRRKGTREQLHWFRSQFTAASADAFGTPEAVLLWDPVTETPSVSDEVLTIRRIKLDVALSWTFSAGAAQGMLDAIGVYLDDLAGTAPVVRDPTLSAATDQRVDWLHLGHSNFQSPGGAVVLFAGQGPLINGTDSLHPDIRAMRKVEQDRKLLLSFNLIRQDPATFAAPTQTRAIVTGFVSVLWQRTRR